MLHTLRCQAHLWPHEFEKEPSSFFFPSWWSHVLVSPLAVLCFLDWLQVCTLPGCCDCEQYNVTTIIRTSVGFFFSPCKWFLSESRKAEALNVTEGPPGPTCLLQDLAWDHCHCVLLGGGKDSLLYRVKRGLVANNTGVQWQFLLSFVYSGTLFDFNHSIHSAKPGRTQFGFYCAQAWTWLQI